MSEFLITLERHLPFASTLGMDLLPQIPSAIHSDSNSGYITEVYCRQMIRNTVIEDAKALSQLVDSVARERRFLASTKGFTVDSTESFIQFVLAANGVHLVAVVDDAIIGWCDITPVSFEGMTHVGRLGMGVKASHRGRGIGKRLLKTALERAFGNGLERVELEVFRSNQAAVHLYQSQGFVHEGIKVNARKMDGISDDILLFASFKDFSLD